MFKKWSRRSSVSLAIACLTFAVVYLWGPKEASTASVFSGTQQWAINSNGWNIIYRYNFNTQNWVDSGWNFGSGNIPYSLPFGANKAYYLFDQNTGRWTEAIYLQDAAL